LIGKRERELINPENVVGVEMKTIFGACDINSVDEISDVINKIEEGRQKVLHIIENKITVIRSHLNVTESNTVMINQIKSKKIQKDELNKIFILLWKYENETQILNDIVINSKSGIVNYNILTPTDIAENLNEIIYNLKISLNTLIETNRFKINKLNEIKKNNVYYKNNKLVFITEISLLTDLKFSLFNILPLPIIMPGSRNNVILSIDYSHVNKGYLY